MRCQITLRLDGRLLESYPVQLRLSNSGGYSPSTLNDIAAETPTGVVFGAQSFGLLLSSAARERIQRTVGASGLPAALEIDLGAPRTLGVYLADADGPTGHLMAVDPATYPNSAPTNLDTSRLLDLLSDSQIAALTQRRAGA